MDRDWMVQAECRSIGHLFDDWVFGDSEEEQHLFVQAYCSYCPVKARCRDYGLAFEETQPYRAGVWGGMTVSDRKEYARTSR